MKRLLLALALISGVSFAQAQRLDTVAVRLDGKAGGTTPTGTANRFALFGPTGTLTTDAYASFSGSGASLIFSVPAIQTTSSYAALTDTTQALKLDGTTSIVWSVGGGYTATKDLGLARASAGVMDVTDGSSGRGSIRAYIVDAASSFTLTSAVGGQWSPTFLALPSDSTLRFSSTTNSTGTPDLGLARASAGVLKVTDGSTGAGKILVADGSAAAPSYSFASDPTAGFFMARGQTIGIGFGAEWWNVDPSRLSWAGVAFLRGMSAGWQLGAAANGTPVANTLIIGESGSGTNIAGANGTISSGIGTGSGTGSVLIFSTPEAHGSDAVAQTPTERLRLTSSDVRISPTGAWAHRFDATNFYFHYGDTASIGYAGGGNEWRNLYLSRATLGSKSKALTDNTATDFATFTIADGATYTGEVIYKVKSVKGTALQALAGRARFAATREGSTYTVAVSEVGTQTLAAAAGTLTGAISISGTGGVVTLTATFDTSQSSPDSMTIDYRFDSPDAGLAITPQ